MGARMNIERSTSNVQLSREPKEGRIRIEVSEMSVNLLANFSCGKAGGLKTWFLPNEPTVFRRHFQCIHRTAIGLELGKGQFCGGFVLENEPTGTPQVRGRERINVQLSTSNAQRSTRTAVTDRRYSGTEGRAQPRTRAWQARLQLKDLRFTEVQLQQARSAVADRRYSGRGGPRKSFAATSRALRALRRGYSAD